MAGVPLMSVSHSVAPLLGGKVKDIFGGILPGNAKFWMLPVWVTKSISIRTIAAFSIAVAKAPGFFHYVIQHRSKDQPNSQANVGRSTALRCIEASSLPSTGACAGVAWVRSRTVRVVCRWGSDRGCGRGYEVPVMIREGCGKSKWKFKMAFAMKGGG